MIRTDSQSERIIGCGRDRWSFLRIHDDLERGSGF